MSNRSRKSPILAAAWGAFSTIVTLLSLGTIIDDLRAWAALINWISDHAPEVLATLSQSLASTLRAIVTPWHHLSEWVIGLFPWNLPTWAFSLFTVLGMAISGTIRTYLDLKHGLAIDKEIAVYGGRYAPAQRNLVYNRSTVLWNRMRRTRLHSVIAVAVASGLLILDYLLFPVQ